MAKQIKSPFTDEYVRGLEEGKRHQQPSPLTLARLDKIEKTIEPLPAWMQHVIDRLDFAITKIESSEKKLDYTNGKVATLMAWKSEVTGAKKALWGVWSVVGIFVVAGIFTLFNMWAQLQHLNARLEFIGQSSMQVKK